MSSTTTAPSENGARPWDAALSAGLALPVGALCVALFNAVAIAVAAPWPGSLGRRLAHHGFDFSATLGVGLTFGLVIGLGRRIAHGPVARAIVLYACAATLGMHVVLGADLERQALVALEGDFVLPLHGLFTVLCGLAIVAAHLVGALLSRFRRLRWLPIVIAMAGLVTNQLVVRDDYPGLHGSIIWTAATLLGATLAPHAQALAQRWTPSRRLAAALALLGLAGLALSPPNDLRVTILDEPGASASWLLARALWSLPSAEAPTLDSPWFSPRDEGSTVAPSAVPLLDAAPVVVFVTIDAVRADVIDDPSRDTQLPNLASLKREGAYFRHAISPGSQTSVSLTSAFAGRYFSELRFAMYGEGSSRFAYAAGDETPRFPALLTLRGIATESFLSINFLAADYGVLRGFGKEQLIAKGRAHAPAREVVEPLLRRLRSQKDGPLFLYAHLTEPHSPYDRGKLREGPDFERYVSEIAVADDYVGRILRTLEQRFPDRYLLIVSSDHGEAFGEHHTTFHTKTLYEELLHVPLLVKGKTVGARAIDQRVSLMDVGPTILDIFGVAVPSRTKGQSLVPLLRGQDVVLDRPILAEGRLRRALYLGRLKVIEDLRRKTVEIYDLSTDPKELQNLFDEDNAEHREALAALRAFFTAHALTEGGYEPPYKP